MFEIRATERDDQFLGDPNPMLLRYLSLSLPPVFGGDDGRG